MAQKGSDKDQKPSEEEQPETEDSSSLLGSLIGGLLDIPGQAVKIVPGTPVEQVSRCQV